MSKEGSKKIIYTNIFNKHYRNKGRRKERKDGEKGGREKVWKSFSEMVLIEYQGGLPLLFPTQCPSASFMILAT